MNINFGHLFYLAWILGILALFVHPATGFDLPNTVAIIVAPILFLSVVAGYDRIYSALWPLTLIMLLSILELLICVYLIATINQTTNIYVLVSVYYAPAVAGHFSYSQILELQIVRMLVFAVLLLSTFKMYLVRKRDIKTVGKSIAKRIEGY